jgi:DNA-binding NarL/FixJ family response regulator
MVEKKRILIVDDHPILRKGLRSLLASHQDFDVVGEAENGREAVDSVEKLRPDLVMMDISMPRMNGLDASREIKRKRPEVKIMALTVNNSPEYIMAAIKAGVDGYILKDASGPELVQAIEDIFSGKEVFRF